MINKRELLEINKLVFEYVMNLEDNIILELLKGNKKLSTTEEFDIKNDDNALKINEGQAVEKSKNTVEKKQKQVNRDSNNNIELIEEGKKLLSNGLSRNEALDCFKNKVFTVKILKDIAKDMDVYIKSRSTKGEVIDKLIEATIGARLKMRALKKG